LEFKRALNRLKKDVWALVSALYILGVCGIAVFAYQLAPDSTRFANQMRLSIHSKPPGFSCQVLTIPRNEVTVDQSFFEGSLNTYEEIPVEEIQWSDQGIAFKRYGNATDYFETVSFTQFPEGIQQADLERLYIKEKYFLFGTDKYGRDLLSRLLIGSRISISIGFVAVLISLLLGIFLGALAGFYGGWLDKLILWFINVMWSIPTLLMVIAITLALGRGFWQVFIAVGLTMWVEVARLVRGLVKSTKEEVYIQAGTVLGFSKTRILVNHILPMTLAPLIVISAANFASAILMESGLSFLGIGAQPPMPSWGGMVKDHFRYLLLGKPYLAILPGLAIMSLVLAFMILGNSLRDALDVRR
jgi:peptide/nickel transport system permease protein|tara:strand:- start:6148 stop:7224 length:1077 start_codon:yes stop_codon:yes gene_type:complete